MSERRGTLGTRSPVIGLIGPIGCGKSQVARWLAGRGAIVIDADELTREAMAPGTAVTRAIVDRFGADVARQDGSIDRAALGRVVFADPLRLAELESIVHPAVTKLERGAIRAADARRPRAIVLEAIRLVEAGHVAWCDEVWLVDCDPGTQLARLAGRGTGEPDARQRVAAQAASLPLWRASATRILRTDGDLVATERAVADALEAATRAR